VSAKDRVLRLGAVAVMIASGLTVVGCGGSGSSGGSSSTGSGTSTAAATAPATTSTTSSAHAGAHHKRPRRVIHGPRVGARQGVHTDGTDLTVTILRVLGLTDTCSPTLPGTRQVGVELRIANQAGATYDSTASGDVSLVLAAGEAEPLDIRRGVCETPLQDFESIVSAGSVRTGCVAFSVPKRARVIGVRFSPHSRPRGALTWRIR
jgi:hypothetical protein